MSSFYIEGPKGNCLSYHDNGFYASVKYLYGEDQHINDILKQVFIPGSESRQAFRKAMIQEESLNRF